MWDHGPGWRLPGIRVKMNKCAANWFSQNSLFGGWSWDTLEVESIEVTWIQNFTPSSIPQCRFVQKLNEHFPTFICFYLLVHFLLLLKTRKKARMPWGSPFLGCPSPVLPAREVPVNLAQSVLSWGYFFFGTFPPALFSRFLDSLSGFWKCCPVCFTCFPPGQALKNCNLKQDLILNIGLSLGFLCLKFVNLHVHCGMVVFLHHSFLKTTSKSPEFLLGCIISQVKV